MDVGAIAARNVRGERARRGWRQKDLADALGWSIDTVSNLETGQRKVTLADVPLLCQVFGIDISRLLLGADPEDLRLMGLLP